MKPSLRTAFASGEFVLAPGVHDLITAAVFRRHGFRFAYASGYWMTASAYGLPDAGLVTYTQMVDRVRLLAGNLDAGLIADADTGYGGLLNVRHTVIGYEQAGISGIQLEDQEVPKKCGHTPGRRVIPADEMVLKIKVAVEARRDPNFLIVARTDARTTLGLEEAIRRGRIFAEAGADVVFVESPETEAEMAEIGRSIAAPLLANMVEGGRTPILPAATLEKLGYAIAIYPAVGFLAAAAALERAYAHLKQHGDSNALAPSDSYGFGRICETMGFPEVWEFDRRWAVKENAE